MNSVCASIWYIHISGSNPSKWRKGRDMIYSRKPECMFHVYIFMNQVHSPGATPSARRANAPKSHWGLLLLLFATPSQLSCKSKSLPLCTYQHTYSIYIYYIYKIRVRTTLWKKRTKNASIQFLCACTFRLLRSSAASSSLYLLLPLFTCFCFFFESTEKN